MLKEAKRPLLGPGCTPLDVLGFTNVPLHKGEKRMQEDVYVIRGLHSALLSKTTSVDLITLTGCRFQNRMTTEVTEGLEGVVCHMDDVFIWGAHRENMITAFMQC